MKIVRFCIAALAAIICTAVSAIDYKIVTASETGTYIQLGKDLSTMVASPVGINLQAVPSAGSVENIERLRYEQGVKLAFVQSDVFQAYKDRCDEREKKACDIIKPLKVILPLYNEEIHFIVRADSPLTYIHEIKGKKINIGPIGSGTALTSVTLYKLMYNEPLPSINISTLSNEEGLMKLIGEKSIDVAVVVAGQPAKIFTQMSPEAKTNLKILKLDPKSPIMVNALDVYFPATVRQISYPNLLTSDVLSLSVKAYLVTYDFNPSRNNQSPSAEMVAKFTQSLCTNLPILQDAGHSKWRDVEIALPVLGKGWEYYGPSTREISACLEKTKPLPSPTPIVTAPMPEPVSKCKVESRVLGLCKE